MTFQNTFLFNVRLFVLLYLIYVRASMSSACGYHTAAIALSAQHGGILSRPPVSIVTVHEEDWLVRSTFGSQFVMLIIYCLFFVQFYVNIVVNIISKVQLHGNRYIYCIHGISEKTVIYSFRPLLKLYGEINCYYI